MAKRGLDISSIQSVLKDIQENIGWSICIGAGTSVPVLPDWFQLVEKLILENCEPKEVIDIKTYKKWFFRRTR